MNLIIIQHGECVDGIVTIATTDPRFVHIFEVLTPDDDDVVKVGILDGKRGPAKVQWTTAPFEDKPDTFARVDDGLPVLLLGHGNKQTKRIGVHYGHKDKYTTGECLVLGLQLHLIEEGMKEPEFEPCIDLLLASPRPKVMDRLLQTLGTLGLRHVTICQAEKVEKSYLYSPKLKPEKVREKLLDGISQANCHTKLPELKVSLAPFEKAVEIFLNAHEETDLKIVGHPGTPLRVRDIVTPENPGRIIIAVGPEAGWTDAEVEFLMQHGFKGVTLGPRILKTTEALISMVALVYDAL